VHVPTYSLLKTIKSNGGVESRLCVRSITAGCRLTTLPWRTVASSTCVINKNPHRWISFMANAAARYSKMQRISAYTALSLGLPPL